MSIEARVTYVNRETFLATADIGFGEALVLEFNPEASIDVGDQLEQLACGYRKLRCVNRSKEQEVSLVVLCDALPMGLAEFVVESGISEERLSKVA